MHGVVASSVDRHEYVNVHALSNFCPCLATRMRTGGAGTVLGPGCIQRALGQVLLNKPEYISFRESTVQLYS